MLKAKTYSLKGTKLEDFSLPKEFGEKENLPLLAQAVRVYEERSHIGFAKTKTRTEVNRTTKKIYAVQTFIAKFSTLTQTAIETIL